MFKIRKHGAHSARIWVVLCEMMYKSHPLSLGQIRWCNPADWVESWPSQSNVTFSAYELQSNSPWMCPDHLRLPGHLDLDQTRPSYHPLDWMLRPSQWTAAWATIPLCFVYWPSAARWTGNQSETGCRTHLGLDCSRCPKQTYSHSPYRPFVRQKQRAGSYDLEYSIGCDASSADQLNRVEMMAFAAQVKKPRNHRLFH